MKIKYLNYSQASAICKDYQHLVGSPFSSNDKTEGMIRQVVVAPYSRILQWKFVQSLLNGIDPGQAIAICPNGRYDVLVLPDQDGRDTLNYRLKSIRCYLQDEGCAFNSSNYNVLRTL